MVLPKIGVPQNWWFTMENPIKFNDLGVDTTIFGNTQMFLSHFSSPDIYFLKYYDRISMWDRAQPPKPLPSGKKFKPLPIGAQNYCLW